MKKITEKEQSAVLTPHTPNATYFEPSEGSVSPAENGERRIDYDRMKLYNRGTWKDRREENKQVTHKQDNNAILDAIVGQLELNPFQKKKARRIFNSLDHQSIGKPTKLVAFGVAVCVANDDVEKSRFYPKMDNPDELFMEVAEELGFKTSQLYRIIHLVENRRNE